MVTTEFLQEASARLARMLEALADGEVRLAYEIGEQLEHDLADAAAQYALERR